MKLQNQYNIDGRQDAFDVWVCPECVRVKGSPGFCANVLADHGRYPPMTIKTEVTKEMNNKTTFGYINTIILVFVVAWVAILAGFVVGSHL